MEQTPSPDGGPQKERDPMKQLLASLAITFSTYSRIPMPQVEWNEKNMRHTMVLLPLVGLAVCGLYCLADWLSALLGLNGLLRAALLTVLPVCVTGGIHLDGYCDTVDALASHAPREKKLQILKDSSAGAFAVIWCCVWFLLCFALTSQVVSVPTAAAGFVLSRAFAVLAIEHLPSARAGMGATLKSGSRFPWWAMVLYLAVYAGLVLLWGDLLAGGAALLAMTAFYFYFRAMALREFGGFTGDLAGWFIQMGELVALAAVVLAERGAALWR